MLGVHIGEIVRLAARLGFLIITDQPAPMLRMTPVG